MDVPLIYLDAHLLVLNKPSGLLAVPGKGADKQDCLSARVERWFPEAKVVHRLDRDTSGVMLMARSHEMQTKLSGLFERREVQKFYVAEVWGNMTADKGEFHWPLRKDFDHPPRHCVDEQLGKPATTRWQVLERQANRTRLLLEPHTGRSHQLRVHCQQAGHPILGDPLYASPPALALVSRLMLHAWRVSLAHPHSHQPHTYTVPCPWF